MIKIHINRFLKYCVIKVLREFLKFVGCGRLTLAEKKGVYQTLTFLKFTRKNKLAIPFSLGRTIRGVSYRQKEQDAFLSGVGDLRDNIFCEDKFLDVMLPALESERGKKIKDFLPEFGDRPWSNEPIWAFSYPWDTLNIEQKKDVYADLLLKNRQDYVHDVLANLDVYDPKNFSTHGNQFRDLYSSIKQKGYIPKDNLPRVNVLVHKNEYRWVMSGDGNHRMYLLNALGEKTPKVEISLLIKRSRLPYFIKTFHHPYTIQDAEMIFDMVFEGKNCLRGLV